MENESFARKRPMGAVIFCPWGMHLTELPIDGPLQQTHHTQAYYYLGARTLVLLQMVSIYRFPQVLKHRSLSYLRGHGALRN